MKAIRPDGPIQATPQPSHSKPSPSQHNDFKDLLSETAKASEPSGAVSPSGSLAEPRPIGAMPQASPPRRTYVDRAKQVIDLMDQYSKALADPKKSLKDIHPVLNEFAENANTLHSDYEKAAKAPTELSKILEDLRRAAQLETIRFQRGDYVDTDNG